MVMKDSRVQCDFCGVWIPLDMFRRGRAVVILKKKYCPACIRETVRDSRPKARAPLTISRMRVRKNREWPWR